MPRMKVHTSRRMEYWWTQEIATLRYKVILATRRLKRIKRRRRYSQDNLRAMEETWDSYNNARRIYSTAIRRSKALTWKQLIDDLDRDPWGYPYKIVLKKLQHNSRVTENVDPNFIREVVDTLFPFSDEIEDPIPRIPVFAQDLAPEVTFEEMALVTRKLRGRKAPGPDGIPRQVLSLIMEDMHLPFKELFTACLQEGQFPRGWKRSTLVLLPKPGKSLASPSSFRPICLLDEMAKLWNE